MSTYILFTMWIVGLGLSYPLMGYPSRRLRNELKPPSERDPQLGRKFALEFILHGSLMLVFIGLLISAADAIGYTLEMEKKMAEYQKIIPVGDDPVLFVPPTIPVPRTTAEWWNPTQRTAATLCLSGLLHGMLVAGVLLFFTNHRKEPGISTMFVVYRCTLLGCLMIITNTFGLYTMFAEGPRDDVRFTMVLAQAFVCGPTFVLHLFWIYFIYKSRAAANESSMA